MTTVMKDRRGIAHVALILLVVAVLAVIGFVGWKVMGKGDNSIASKLADNAATKEAKAECEKKNDKDLCKFVTNWKMSEQFRITSKDKTGTSIFEIDGKKSHMKMTGEYAYETITIDNATYTKAGDVWYKQVTKTTEVDATKPLKDNFDDPEDDSVPAEDRTTYKALGKEACGNLNCFKYEVINPDQADVKQFIWFDDKDYKMRKSSTVTKDDGTSEQTYEYSKISISVPSPVKELGPNQYIVPGQTEPVTAPDPQMMPDPETMGQ